LIQIILLDESGGQVNTPTAASYGMRSWGDNQWGNQNEVDASLTGLGLTSSIGECICI
jgi:hypothetical protein